MPAVFRERGMRFFFYSDEGEPLEPVHIHVHASGNEAKFWVKPHIWLAWGKGFRPNELKLIQTVVEKREQEIVEAWNEFFDL